MASSDRSFTAGWASGGTSFSFQLPGWTDFQLPTSNFSCEFSIGFWPELIGFQKKKKTLGF
jgi:hypothetical protein